MSNKKSIGKPTTERSASQSKKKKVELDLPDVLEGELRKEAEDECRTLEQHMLYILKTRSRVLRKTWIESIKDKDLVCRSNPRPGTFNWEINRNWDGSPKVTY